MHLLLPPYIDLPIAKIKILKIRGEKGTRKKEKEGTKSGVFHICKFQGLFHGLVRVIRKLIHHSLYQQHHFFMPLVFFIQVHRHGNEAEVDVLQERENKKYIVNTKKV
jgi:hypothetical protein